jgi:error-prone DNA polymerase
MSAATPDPGPPYVELAVTSCFSFLRGASLPEDLLKQAAALDYAGFAVTDINTLAGIVRPFRARRELVEQGFPVGHLQIIPAARLRFLCGAPDVLAYPQDREGYARLCRLITRGKRGEAEKGECRLTFEDLLTETEGMALALAAPERPDDTLEGWLDRLLKVAPDRVWLAAAMRYGPMDARRLDGLAQSAARTGAKLLAVGDVLYHAPERRALQDVMTCIREHVPLEAAGRLLEPNAERHLKPRAEIARLFKDHPEAVAETLRLAATCRFDLPALKYEYPHEPIPPGETPQGYLERLTWAGAAWRYPKGVPDTVRQSLKEEFDLIARAGYAYYFLTVHDIVNFARGAGILCQGRGSAANSVVCYCLGVTAVDPTEVQLLFARFVSEERGEPPDIDVDFEHERREEVIQYIYNRYGRHRAAICATVIHYRPRSAIREVGKVLGLTEDVTAALAGTVWGSWGEGLPDEHIRQTGVDPANPVIRRAVCLATDLIGFPRHLSQHVGGFVLTERRLDETVPIANAAMADRTFIEWDKDDLDELKILKVDVLALGMLTCIRKAFDLLNHWHEGQADWTPIADMADLEPEAEDVYAMISAADTIGVFQIESRAQMSMLPRLKPKTFYDLVIEVAIVRPGPIQGNMVHPYLKQRASGKEIVFPKPKPPHPANELEHVLGRTLGVPLFQEQAMQLAIVAAEFKPHEADGLRRAMATFRNRGGMEVYEEKMVGKMIERGYELEFAQNCFNQIRGFGSYGFPESHAASFAKLVYVSAFIKKRYPAAFACALLNAQPMGFYAPAQIVRDAREHGVEVRPVDVEHSDWDCTLETTGDPCAPALRLGFRQIDGFSETWADRLMAARGAGFGRFDALARRSGVTPAQLQRLADADAMRSIGLDRRQALWQVRGLSRAAPAPLLQPLPDEEAMVALPQMAPAQHVLADYQTMRLSLKAHPMSFLRQTFDREGILTCQAISEAKDRAKALLAGVVLVRQRPGTGTVCFITLEDETGIANLAVMPEVFKTYRRTIMSARLLEVHGRVQKSPEGVVHVLALKLVDRTGALKQLDQPADLFASLAPADPVKTGGSQSSGPQSGGKTVHDRYRAGHPRDVRVILPSRDFH